jgi:hypothetical protein
MKKEIKDQFVPYDMAKAMLMLDYDAICFAYYRNSQTLNLFDQRSIIGSNQDIGKVEYIKAALWQQAFDWFREEHFIDFKVDRDFSLQELPKQYCYVIEDEDGLEESKNYNTYEEAKLACLEKLIEIIKKQK